MAIELVIRKGNTDLLKWTNEVRMAASFIKDGGVKLSACHFRLLVVVSL
jgi:hypothetical protein